MNYFLGYDNSTPLFIGGKSHGTKRRVPKEWGQYVQVPIDLDLVDLYRSRASFGLKEVRRTTETYRREIFIVEDRRFEIMMHESLPAHAGFMLMLSTVGAHPDLVKRVANLEWENQCLKAENRFLKEMMKEVFQ